MEIHRVLPSKISSNFASSISVYVFAGFFFVFFCRTREYAQLNMCSFVCSSIFDSNLRVLFVAASAIPERKSNHLFGNDHKISMCQCALRCSATPNDDVQQTQKKAVRNDRDRNLVKRIVANASRMRKMKYFALSSTDRVSMQLLCWRVIYLLYVLFFEFLFCRKIGSIGLCVCVCDFFLLPPRELFDMG